MDGPPDIEQIAAAMESAVERLREQVVPIFESTHACIPSVEITDNPVEEIRYRLTGLRTAIGAWETEHNHPYQTEDLITAIRNAREEAKRFIAAHRVSNKKRHVIDIDGNHTLAACAETMKDFPAACTKMIAQLAKLARTQTTAQPKQTSGKQWVPMIITTQGKRRPTDSYENFVDIGGDDDPDPAFRR